MLTGNMVRVKFSKQRIVPLYLDRGDPQWLEAAESLLMIFRDAVGRTRGEIEEEIEALLGEGMANLVHRGLAKVLEDRSEFEIVSEVVPALVRETVFGLAAEHRKSLAGAGFRAPFDRDHVLRQAAEKLGVAPNQVSESLFADLRDENRMLKFDDITPERLIDRYNVALAQAVLLRSTLIHVEIRGEKPQRYRQLFRWLKFHRLLYKAEGSMKDGYTLHIDGPLSLFSSTTKYGFQIALFLPALLLCGDFRLDAELEWGTEKQHRLFHLENGDGLVSHYKDAGAYIPAEIRAFEERFRQVAPDWELSEATDIIELGREGVWTPDYKFIHRPTGTDVYVDVLGFWRKASLERLLRLLPKHGPPRYLLLITEKLKVEEAALGELKGPVLRYREIPNASDLANTLENFRGGLFL